MISKKSWKRIRKIIPNFNPHRDFTIIFVEIGLGSVQKLWIRYEGGRGSQPKRYLSLRRGRGSGDQRYVTLWPKFTYGFLAKFSQNFKIFIIFRPNFSKYFKFLPDFALIFVKFWLNFNKNFKFLPDFDLIFAIFGQNSAKISPYFGQIKKISKFSQKLKIFRQIFAHIDAQFRVKLHKLLNFPTIFL